MMDNVCVHTHTQRHTSTVSYTHTERHRDTMRHTHTERERGSKVCMEVRYAAYALFITVFFFLCKLRAICIGAT